MKPIRTNLNPILLGVLSASLALPWIALADGSDNFNDNSKDTAKWGADTALALGVLTEQNQRLEFTCNNALSDGDTLRPWKIERFPVNADWTIQIDTFNSTAPSIPSQVSSGGLTLFHPTNSTSDVYVELYAAPFGSPVNKGFDANLETAGANAGSADTGQIAGSEAVAGAVRLEYNAATKVVTCLIDTNTLDGYQWTALATFGLAGAGGSTANTDWGLATNQQFTVWVYGYSAGMTVASGQLYLDNFAETGGSTPGAGPSPIPVGNFHFGFPTNNLLLAAIASLTGNYTGSTPVNPARTYNIDAAQDESGKVVTMGTMDGILNAEGGPELSGGAIAVTTVNNKPTLEGKASWTGSADARPITAKIAAVTPVEFTDIGGGSNGFNVAVNGSTKVAGVPLTFQEMPVLVPATPSMEANLKKNWTLTLDISQKTVSGKTSTVATAQLLLPNGDTIQYPERTVKYSATKGYKLSFKKGTNTTVLPNRQDKKSAITITGLTFTKQGDAWQPTGGSIAYSFLGQRGTANLLDFTGP